MENPNKKSWVEDFQEFINSDSNSAHVPENLSHKVLDTISAKLNPSALDVFIKVALLHAIASTLTLLFCPQFGLSLTSGMGLMQIFMRYGHSACMLACGVLFMSFGLLLASLILRPEEVRVLRANNLYFLLSLSGLSLGMFLCLGGQIFQTMTLVWLLGTLLGGGITLDLGWRLRRFSLSRSL